MKNMTGSTKISVMILGIIALSSLEIKAQIIEDSARIIAKNHYYKYSQGKIDYNNILPELVYVNKESDTINFYAFNINSNKGFVIVSGSDIENPIIGYSFNGRFVLPDSSAPPEYTQILKNRSRKKILHVNDKIKGELPSRDEYSKQNLTGKTLELITNIDPLLQTKWGQGQYYNDSIPEYNGSKMVVGCVATAVSQLMKFYNYPLIGSGNLSYESPVYNFTVKPDFGNTQYRWDLMPNEISEPNSYIAQLCYHVGVAINTDFTPTESASSIYSARDALIKYFNYSDRIGIVYTPYFENNGLSWKDSLRNEISRKNPVIFAADKPNVGGHAFICDGFQDSFFHFNFGWTGFADGYYNLDDIDGFNDSKTFLTNLRPPEVTFAISDLAPEINEVVSLRLISKGITDQRQWTISPTDIEFVNGTNMNSLNPQVSFKKTGDYNIQLIATIQGEKYQINKTIQVTFINKTTFNNGTVTACKQSAPLKWFDYDDDGDLDLIQCIMTRINGTSTILYNNNKGVFEKTNISFPTSYNGSISTFDYNNDGFLDVFIMSMSGYKSNSIRVYKNVNGQSFEEVILSLPQLAGGTILPGDINNDGWLDLLLIGKNYAESETLFHYYVLQNNKDNFSIAYHDSVQTDPFYRNDNIADFADLNNDGYLDIVIHEVTNSKSESGIKILINNKGKFSTANHLVKGLGEGAIITGDFDNDSNVDILSSSDSGTSIFFNRGNSFLEKKIIENRPWYGGGWWVRVDCNDINDDGKMDFTESGGLRSMIYYSKYPQNYEVLNVSNPEEIGIDTHLGDYNNDGFVDLAVSNNIYRNYQGNNSFTMNTAPTTPLNLKHNINDTIVVLSWNKSTDQQTPQNGLSYNLSIGTTVGGVDVMSPQADLKTGKRKIVKMGNTFLNNSWGIKNLKSGMYYWRVQAIDNGFKNSPFSSIDSFYISNIKASKYNPCIKSEIKITLSSLLDTCGYNSYEWNFDGGHSVNQNSDGPFNIHWDNLGLKTIKVKYKDKYNNIFYDSLQIDVSGTERLVNLKIEGPLIACAGKELKLDGGSGFSGYLWSTGENSQTINVTKSGTYSVIVTDNTGCTNKDNVVVSFDALPEQYNVTGGGAYCPGGNGSVIGLANSQAGINYQLLLGNIYEGVPLTGLGTPISFGEHTTFGTYTVLATNITTSCTSIMKGSTLISNYNDVIPKISLKWNDVLICYNLGDSISNFQWYKDNSIITNANGQYYVSNKKTGSYKVETIDNNGCKNFSNVISISGTKSLSVYPNPASETFTLKLSDDLCGRAMIRILNSEGEKIIEFEVENIQDELFNKIPVYNLKTGIYSVQVMTENQDLYYTKIVVIK